MCCYPVRQVRPTTNARAPAWPGRHAVAWQLRHPPLPQLPASLYAPLTDTSTSPVAAAASHERNGSLGCSQSKTDSLAASNGVPTPQASSRAKERERHLLTKHRHG